MSFDIVVPTIGRPVLARLLASIARARGTRPDRIFLVDDRRARATELPIGSHDDDLHQRIEIVAGRAAGPASARNLGWRRSTADWIAFLDDDVVVTDTWLADFENDIAALPDDVAASQGRVRVPLATGRKPTDWERNVRSLETARWITADCAYRRRDLLAAGGFDERFTRAFREDADLALRIIAVNKRIVTGTRCTLHPAGPAAWNVSIRLQAGNADDVLMLALHGPDWYEKAGAPRGTYRRHALTVALTAVATAAGLSGKRTTAAFAAFGAASLLAMFTVERLRPGPLTPAECATMLVTSVAIPFAAVYHRMRGLFGLRALLADAARAPRPLPRAVLFDRDGTLIVDVPYNRDVSRVQVMPGARSAIARLRSAGVATAVISNQDGVGRGRLSLGDLRAINDQVERLLGGIGPIFACTHAPHVGCACRKPQPGLLMSAARSLGVAVHDCVVVGDIGADMEAARRAGARGILVPTAATRREEIDAAPLIAGDIERAVDLILGEVP